MTIAQRLLGHSDPIMTLKIYTSALDNEVDDAGTTLRINLQIKSGGNYPKMTFPVRHCKSRIRECH